MPTIWSNEELDVLKQVYPVTQSRKKVLEALPDKQWTSIRHKAGELGLTKNNLGIWSIVELEALRKNWSNKSKPELLDILPDKSWSSIRHKAFELGVKKERHRVRYWHTYKEPPKVVLTDRQIGYFAGIIDGEGMIVIKRAKENGAIYYAPYIGITNTDKGLMEKCMEIFKGGRFITKQMKKNPNWKTCYVYNIASVRGVKQILTQLVDEFTVKKPMAQLVLEFIKVKEEKQGFGLDPREEELFQKVRELNARGKGAPKQRGSVKAFFVKFY
jgi:hypothetical protein